MFIWDLSVVATSTVAAILRGNAGVYQWVNSINGKTYVGSSCDLYRRFLEYLNPSHLARELLRGESHIYKAMLKYGYSAFSFQILEFVPLDPSLSISEQNEVLLAAEQKYIVQLNPEYNILLTAGSNKGHKLSDEAKAKISSSKKGQPSHKREYAY